MDLTGVFIGRRFNTEVKEDESPPHPNSMKVWDFQKGRYKYIPDNSKRTEKEEGEYNALIDYYKHKEEEDEDEIRNWRIRGDEDEVDWQDKTEKNWINKHMDYEERRQRKQNISRYLTADTEEEYNNRQLYDDLQHELMHNYHYNSNEDSKIITVEDEIELIRSYHKDELYLDKNNVPLKVVNRTDSWVELICNPQLPKYNQNSKFKINRVDFLMRMNFKPGSPCIIG